MFANCLIVLFNPLYHLRKYRKQAEEIFDLSAKLTVVESKATYLARCADRAAELEKQVKSLTARVNELTAELNREKADNQVIKLLYPKGGL